MQEASSNIFENPNWNRITNAQRLQVHGIILSPEDASWDRQTAGDSRVATEALVLNRAGKFFEVIQGSDGQGNPVLLYRQIEPGKPADQVIALVEHCIRVRNGIEEILITISNEAGALTSSHLVLKPFFQGSVSNTVTTGWQPQLEGEGEFYRFQANGKGGHAHEKRNEYRIDHLDHSGKEPELKPNQIWISLAELKKVAPEYLGEHLRYSLGASLFTSITPAPNLEWDYKALCPEVPRFIPGEAKEEWSSEEGPILIQHKNNPDQHTRVEYIECGVGNFKWNQPILRLPEWGLKSDESIKGHDMAVAVRRKIEGKFHYLMRPQKELGINRPLVGGAIFGRINQVEDEPLWEALKEHILGQIVREPMDGSRLSEWRLLAFADLTDEEVAALEKPEGYEWLTEAEISFLMQTGDLHDGFLEACSLFKLKQS